MAGATVVTSPDGDRWRVRRRWMDRAMPSLRKHLRDAKDEHSAVNAFDGWMIADGAASTGWTGLAIAAIVLLLFIVFLPLLGVALELILLLVLFSSGLIGRVLLGRPWTVEAINLDHGERSVAYGVKGFRRAGDAAGELAGTIAANGPPDRLIAGERTTLPRSTF